MTILVHNTSQSIKSINHKPPFLLAKAEHKGTGNSGDKNGTVQEWYNRNSKFCFLVCKLFLFSVQIPPRFACEVSSVKCKLENDIGFTGSDREIHFNCEVLNICQSYG